MRSRQHLSLETLLRVPSEIHRRDRLFFPALILIGITVFALQYSAGAFQAEFDGFPDEPAQFVSGRMLWEYLRTLPAGDPVAWAGQYYLHYPKIGIGHWPPGYHVLEALWSLLLGSSRASAMGLQWLLSVSALSGIYLLARPRFPVPVTAGVVFFCMAAPIFQQGLEETMAEPASLLCGVLFLHAMLRFLKRVDPISLVWVGISIAASALMKLTAICLLPVPFFALLLMPKGPSLRQLSFLLAGLSIVAGIVLVSPLRGLIAYWGGITSAIEWPIGNLGAIAGWGFVVLAVFGLRRRDPLSVIAFSVVAGAIITSFAVRAMREPRHWITVLPAILLLAAFAVTRLPGWRGALPGLPAALLFPWLWFHQSATGYEDLIRQVHLPARMLVSSSDDCNGEGGWIATIATRERYPASLVARGSKVLAQSGWNGEDYTLLAPDTAAAGKLLDELALDMVILVKPGAASPPHHRILAQTVSHSNAWRICGQTTNLSAWCRTAPPRFPRKPLILEVAGHRFTERLGGEAATMDHGSDRR